MVGAELRDQILCVQCGPGVAVDEDGCCGMCGAQACGPWADRAVAALERMEALEAALRRLEDEASSAQWAVSQVYGPDSVAALDLDAAVEEAQRLLRPAPAGQQGGSDGE